MLTSRALNVLHYWVNDLLLMSFCGWIKLRWLKSWLYSIYRSDLLSWSSTCILLIKSKISLRLVAFSFMWGSLSTFTSRGSGEITHHIIFLIFPLSLRLRFVFGPCALQALDLVEKRSVTCVTSPSGRKVFQVGASLQVWTKVSNDMNESIIFWNMMMFGPVFLFFIM